MATEATPQALDTAVERSGLSVITATKTNDDPRFGSIYRPDQLAAAVPVWFHPLQTGSYLGLFTKRWHTATIGSGGPQTYSAKTVSDLPYWGVINPASGIASGLSEIPSRLSGVRTLTAAVSRIDYLFTVGTVDDVPFIQHLRVDPLGQLILQSEELLEPVAGEDYEAMFDVGLYIDGNYLVVFGNDEEGNLYRRRKNWGRVGINDTREPWTYHAAKGWYSDPAEMEPELTSAGENVLAVGGLVTTAKFSDRVYLAIMNESQADILSARVVDTGWRTEPSTGILGDWVYLQPQLQYVLANVPEGARAAIPYLSVDYVPTSGAESLVVAWDLLPV